MNSKNKIFLVDDNLVSLTAARDMLKETYKVYAATSAAEFFKMIEVVTPDLILMDVDMPDMDGYEAVRILKANKQFDDIPVIFLTAYSDKESELKGFNLGAVDYIVKPIHMLILKARIDAHITILEQRRIIEQLCMTDALTNIPNRRLFDVKLENEWARAIREKQPLGLIMADIDNFKMFNDTYGHQQGDVTLQTVALIVSTSVRRETDIVARWGGEEFAAILPNTENIGVQRVAENIRVNVEKASVPLVEDTSQSLNITVSIGGTSIVPTKSVSIEDFLRKADSSLYEAKTKGKNRVIMF